MILFTTSNVPNTNPFSVKAFTFLGDGKETRIGIDLTKAPLGMSFSGDKFPAEATVNRATGSAEVGRLSVKGSVVSIEFKEPIPYGETEELFIAFWYD